MLRTLEKRPVPGSAPPPGSGSMSPNQYNTTDDDSTGPTSAPASVPENSGASFLENAIISAAIRMSLPTDISDLPKNDHPSLTIQATTINFTRFVHKTTGLFWFQDRVEDVLTWKDPWNTTFVLVLYCFICKALLFFFGLNKATPVSSMKEEVQHQPTKTAEEIYIAAQEKAHHNRYHVYHEEDYLEQVSDSDDENERRSTGVQYLSNLQHIQNMMGDVSDAHDFLMPLVRHLDWSDEAEAIMIVQGIIVAFVGMSVVMWFVPWRWVFMLGGAGGMLSNSPWGKIVMKELVPLSKDVAAWSKTRAMEYKQKRVQGI
ncbi:hypothetical protein BGW38_001464 [Lunasporangiospora selenospora]|uniref:TECPR1-like DysF domain-containing protein n=1 Tax=Lunasporangiospora selenospora TaxID=979761 RepID=A0A9P6FVK3_9FUNG|nr:hypothetical protein BGW38_001464 [Lunasporangiospora selenospora]